MKKITSIILYTFLTIYIYGQPIPVAVETVFQLETVITENPPAISFSWNEIHGDYGVNIYRKGVNSSTWVKIETLPPHINEYTDYDIQISKKYEYKLESSYPGYVPVITYVNAGIKCAETEYRGKLILLVDSMFVEPLQNELSRLETDLIGDGWEIIRRDISRNSSVKQVKNLIFDIYFRDYKNINTLFLVGHIPVPYSGELAFDGHNGIGNANHEGAWPADLYYGDMNELFWTDSKVNNEQSIHTENHNVPGDGKFDPSNLKYPSVVLAVGRVDFFNLPAFAQSETELMRNYLDKHHAFRHKLISPKMQALVDNNLDPLPVRWLDNSIITYEMMALSGWRNFTALLNFDNVKAGKVFNDALNDSYIWTYGCGYGTFTSCSGLGSVSDFVNNSPKTIFTGFYGSFFGDWDTENNFLRSTLASNGWILTSCWSGRPLYAFHHMGMGETIGSCIQRTQNNFNTYYPGGVSDVIGAVNISLMGDPALRMHIVSPVKSLSSQINLENKIKLTWQPPDDEIIGYNVYKLDTTANKFKKINNMVVFDNFFTDVFPEQGNNYYMVRALQLTKSASGSFYNLSQGIFDTIQYVPTNISEFDLKNEINFDVFPNPTSNTITVKVKMQGKYNIKISNMNSQLLYFDYMENTDCQIDLSNYPCGVYLITIKTNEYVNTRKIIKY